MEICVNEYVRTENGFIGKIENINDFRPPESKYAVDIQAEDLVFIGEDFIKKHSPNIIDLIEEGDYIQLEDRGKRFYEVTTDYQGKLAIIDIGWNEYEEIDETYNQDIKSIVTKEQFNQVKYEV